MPERTSAFWAPQKKTAATRCGASAKRCSSWRCATTTCDAIKESGAKRIVTADPHAYNALKHDYRDVPAGRAHQPVHRAEVKAGKIKFTAGREREQGLHLPRPLLPGAPQPGLRRAARRARCDSRTEASGDGRCRDRSFCCGGGGLMLFYEPKEEQRMGVLRVKMAAEAGANVIVTACPFCMVNIEDAIKVAGMEGKMTAIDLTELVDQHCARKSEGRCRQRGLCNGLSPLMEAEESKNNRESNVEFWFV